MVERNPRRIVGSVEELEDGVARILIGPRQDEWWFPTSMLPPETVAGDRIDFAPDGDRYLVIGLRPPEPAVVAGDPRDAAHVVVRPKQVRASDLRRTLNR